MLPTITKEESSQKVKKHLKKRVSKTETKIQILNTKYRKILPKPPSHERPKVRKKIHNFSSTSRIYKCTECTGKFNAFRLLKAHEKMHEEEVSNICSQCFTYFANAENFEQHRKESHKDEKYKCRPCDKCFNKKGHLLNHVNVEHKCETLPFYCSCCPKKSTAGRFMSRLEVQQHYQHVHAATSTTDDDMDIEMNEEFLDEFLLNNGNENSFQFSECWEALDLHLPDMLRLPCNTDDMQLQENSEVAFKCPKCYDECLNVRALLKHLAHSHKLKTLICYKCEAEFNDFTQYKMHKKKSSCSRKQTTHRTNNVAHECPYCSKEITTTFNFKRHLRTVHALLKRHTCQLCDKQYATLDHLKKHVLSQHQNERKHICHVCAKRFTQLCHLKQHLAIHTKSKTLQCSYCIKTFWRKVDLERHTLRKHANSV